MELFTATGKLKKFFFDNERRLTRAPRVTRHTSIRYSSSCPTRINMLTCVWQEHTCQHVDARVARTLILYRCVPCHPRCTHQTSLVVKKKKFQFSCGCEQFH